MNVLLILADQFRWDCLRHVGNEAVHTPNLDRLASEGVSFTHCFNQTAPCGPSRMCIYTSRYQCSTRVVHNGTPLLDAEDNFGFILREAGYDPALIGYNDYTVDPALLRRSGVSAHPLRSQIRSRRAGERGGAGGVRRNRAALQPQVAALAHAQRGSAHGTLGPTAAYVTLRRPACW